MSKLGKQYVLGYYVMKSGTPCVLDFHLHSQGLLVAAKDGQALFVFRRGMSTLWAAKGRCQRAIERTTRCASKLKSSTHLEFTQTEALFAPGDFVIHPCKNLEPNLNAQRKKRPRTKAQQRDEIIADI